MKYIYLFIAILGCSLYSNGPLKAQNTRTEDLNFQNLMKPVPGRAKLSSEDYFIWGGSMVKGEDGKYHLLYSRWEKTQGFRAWLTHSKIAHAVADDPLGPYQFKDIALEDRGAEYWDGLNTHNPIVKKFGDKYYLYYMGTTGSEEKGEEGDFNWLNRNNQRIGVAVANSPNGPWKRFDKPLIDVSKDSMAADALMVNTPSITERHDGGYLMIYKAVAKKGKLPFGGPVFHMAAISESPTGPFVKYKDPIFTSETSDFPGEDPFIWYSNERYWAILNNHEAFAEEDIPLVLFQSGNGIDWKLAKNIIVSKLQIEWENGKVQELHSLERPQIWFDENGEPSVLFLAATEDRETHSFNVHVPLKKE
ncbi:glycoside hydrolase family protein [Membranihabitans maritimus]|uniref:glycoside hydrolase family protein n=1 Tax=Membranihabitans maritimus TaxID=2904244 RepID=UPI001F1C3A82|nr:glycoside hydrolase family protein [Membranihabitans maritimus]